MSIYYVGLDVHQRTSTACILTHTGQHVKTFTVQGHWSAMLDQLARLKKPLAVCFEASLGYGPIHRRLSGFCQRVVVAHPGKLRLIFASRRKHDRVDAKKLAKLLLLDAVPAVHVPSLDVRQWRQTIEFRRSLIDQRTRIKNSLRAILRAEGRGKPRDVGGLWTKRGLAWLSQVELPAMAGLRRDVRLDELAHVQKQITRVTTLLNKLAGQHPGVTLLQSIPGVGPRTAEAFVAYIDDPHRFARNHRVGAYLGLVPGEDSSGGSQRLGHITKEGPATLRKLLIEAAWRSSAQCPHMQARFQRIAGDDRDRRKIAVVALARKLGQIMHAMLRTGEAYRAAA